RYEGDLFLGEARTFLDAGYLFRLRLNRTRREIAVRDSAIEDKVADNLTNSTSLKAKPCSSAEASESAPTSRRVPTAISSSSHSQTAQFMRSLVLDDASCNAPDSRNQVGTSRIGHLNSLKTAGPYFSGVL